MLKSSPLNSQDGHVAIVAALVILTLLAIIGFSASRVANNEVTLARNESVHQRNLYLAEGAAMEAVDILANTGKPSCSPPDDCWVEMTAGSLDIDNLRNYFRTPQGNVTAKPSNADTGRTKFVAGVEGIAPGGSLGMNAPTVYMIGIYGRCEWSGESIVKIGYRAAY